MEQPFTLRRSDSAGLVCSLRPSQSYSVLPRHQGPLMAGGETLTTTVSSKGRVILPKAIRQRRNWQPGTRLVVEDTRDGVLMKTAPVFAPTRPEDVAGILACRGRPKKAGGDGRGHHGRSKAAPCSRPVLM